MTEPFIIQFNSLNHFIADFELTNEAIVRVWPAEFGTGSNLGIRYRAIMVQAIHTAHHAILQTALIIGSYNTMYNSPFGPAEEAVRDLIKEQEDNAEALVKTYLQQNLPDGMQLRPGRIFTGLEGPVVARAYWDGFQTIYDEIKQLRRES